MFFMFSDKDTIYIKNECLCLFQNINIHELKLVAMHELSYLFAYLRFLYLYSH